MLIPKAAVELQKQGKEKIERENGEVISVVYTRANKRATMINEISLYSSCRGNLSARYIRNMPKELTSILNSNIITVCIFRNGAQFE